MSRRRRNEPAGWAQLSGTRLRRQVQVFLTATLLATHAIGAGIVFLISFFVIPAPKANAATVLSTTIAVPVYLVTCLAVGAAVGTIATRRALRWTGDDHAPPSPHDRNVVFKIPFRLTMLQLGMWVGATVLFTLLASLSQPDRAVTTGLTVGTATIVVCGIAYLLTEYALRPIAARALAQATCADHPRTTGIATKMIVFWLVGTGMPTLTLLVAGVLALSGASNLTRLGVTTIVICTVVLVFGSWITMLLARTITAPVRDVSGALRAVERGSLDTDVVVYDGSDLGSLQAGYNQMIKGLRERERLRDLFGRHVGHQVADHAAALDNVQLGGETRTVTVLFVDITGSTRFAEERPASEVVTAVNRFFGIVVTEAERHDGLVNKFMGDAVLVVFGAPAALDDHATPALCAARSIAHSLSSTIHEFDFGIGVATGPVVVGNVGHESRFEYTAMGDAVNAASRLTELAKELPGRILADTATIELVDPDVADHFAPHETVGLRGRREPVATYTQRAGS